MLRPEEINFLQLIKDKNIKTVVDVGANAGHYTAHIRKEFPNSKIYCIEPILSCFNKLQDKFNSDININLINTIISSKNETVTFYEAVGREGHSSIVKRDFLHGDPNCNLIEREIKADTIDGLIDEDIDLLKIDTEGYELPVLKGCKQLLRQGKIRYIQFEYGGTFMDNNIALNDVINYLKQFNYKVYKLKLLDNTLEEIKEYRDDYQWINFFAYI